MNAEWSRLLDDMERRVDQAERFLAGEDVAMDDYARPSGLGPLPVELAERARRVHGATVDVERRLAEEMERVTTRLRHSATAFGPERPEPVYFDRTA